MRYLKNIFIYSVHIMSSTYVASPGSFLFRFSCPFKYFLTKYVPLRHWFRAIHSMMYPGAFINHDQLLFFSFFPFFLRGFFHDFIVGCRLLRRRLNDQLPRYHEFGVLLSLIFLKADFLTKWFPFSPHSFFFAG
jgi:hypothetical protein